MSESAEASQDTIVPDYLGFWARFFAFIIDSIVVLIVLAPITLVMYGQLIPGPGTTSGPLDAVIQYLISALVIVLFWIFRQATPGKMLFGGRIVHARTLAKPSTLQMVGRYLAYFVSTLPFCLGFVWIAFDSRKQGWHDKLAGTVVIKD